MPKKTVGDIEMAYDDRGEGPPILFVMGFTGSRHHWLGFPDRFADRHRVITFDNRGVGESSAPGGGPYAIGQMARDALGLLDALGVGEASVLGVSMGGMIAQEMALAAPDRVKRLVLGCTSFGGPEAVPFGEDSVQLFQSVGKMPAASLVRELVAINFSPAWLATHEDVVQGLVEHGTTHKMPRTGFWGQMGAIAAHDTAARLSAVRTPTLVVAGDADRLIPVENSHRIGARIAGAEVTILPGVGHMFWVEAADEAERIVRAFFERA
jgi:pimeloyl-ACP methyl ester carboxylesterase